MSDDDWQRHLEDALADLADEAPPRDVVRGEGLTVEDLRRMNDAVGGWVEVETPGEVVEDVDGVPSGVGQPARETGMFGGAGVSTDQIEAAGLTEEEFAERFPKLHIMHLPKRKDQNHD